ARRLSGRARGRLYTRTGYPCQGRHLTSIPASALRRNQPPADMANSAPEAGYAPAPVWPDRQISVRTCLARVQLLPALSPGRHFPGADADKVLHIQVARSRQGPRALAA